MKTIEDLTINESVYDLSNGKKGKIAVLIYNGAGDPTKVLDYAVHQYVKDHGYHELVDANLDNPWMRVILSDINNMSQHQFNLETDRLLQPAE
jgi:hypothetical protein